MFNSSNSLLIIALVVTTAIAYAAPTLDESTTSTVTTETPSSSLETTQQDEARGSKMTRRMILPLLVGILLKVGSLLPVIMGKLTLMAVGSIVTSKLALLIAALLVIHKLQTESVWPASSTSTEESYSTYPYRRRG